MGVGKGWIAVSVCMQDTQRKMAVATGWQCQPADVSQAATVEMYWSHYEYGHRTRVNGGPNRLGPARCGADRSSSRPESFRGNDRNYVIKSYNLRLPLQQVRSVPRDPDRGTQRCGRRDRKRARHRRQFQRQTDEPKDSSYTSYRCNSTNRGGRVGWGQRTMNRHR